MLGIVIFRFEKFEVWYDSCRVRWTASVSENVIWLIILLGGWTKPIETKRQLYWEKENKDKMLSDHDFQWKWLPIRDHFFTLKSALDVSERYKESKIIACLHFELERFQVILVVFRRCRYPNNANDSNSVSWTYSVPVPLISCSMGNDLRPELKNAMVPKRMTDRQNMRFD